MDAGEAGELRMCHRVFVAVEVDAQLQTRPLIWHRERSEFLTRQEMGDCLPGGRRRAGVEGREERLVQQRRRMNVMPRLGLAAARHFSTNM